MLIACGGTGGHLFPGLAVGERLVARGDRVLLIVSEKEIDRVATGNIREMAVETLSAVGLPPLFSPRLISFGVKFLHAIAESGRLIEKFQADAVLGMGGFACAAPILAARRRGIPTFLHESNAIPGKASRWLARVVTEVFVGFKESAGNFRPPATVTGTPVRRALEPEAADIARARLGLEPLTFTVLIVGGSQGARSLNHLLLDALPCLKAGAEDIQFIHLAGAKDEEQVRQAYRSANFTAHVAAFFHNMQTAYSAANFVLSRAGASTLAELAHFGLPSLLLPYPHAADRHQDRNAEIFARAGAARVLSQETTDGKTLAAEMELLRRDPPKLRAMATAAASLRHPDACAKIIERIDARRCVDASATSAKPTLSIAVL